MNLLLDGGPDKNSATNCNPQKCYLPDCWCSQDGKRIPNNLTHTEVPQMIMITFNDAVNAENFDFYSSKFYLYDYCDFMNILFD